MAADAYSGLGRLALRRA